MSQHAEIRGAEVLDCVVIGAGITGLSAAFSLKEAGVEVAVVEKESEVGGVMQSHWETSPSGKRYLIELGPNTFQTSNTEIRALCEKLGLVPQRTQKSANRRFLFSNGKMQLFPMGPFSFLFTPLLSLSAKILLAREPQQPALAFENHPEETVAAFFKRRFGQELLSQFVTPFVSGVYAGDPEKLSIHAVFPKLVAWERGFGSVLRGLIHQLKHRPKIKKEPYALMNFPEGMTTLAKAIAAQMPADRCWKNTHLTAIEQEQNGFFKLHFNEQNPVLTRSVLFATPTQVTADYLPFLAPQAATVLRQMPYAPIVILHVAIPKKQLRHPLNGFGVLIPRTEKILMLGAIFTHSLFPQRAPKDMALLTCFYGGAIHPEVLTLSDEELQKQALKDLQHVLNQNKGADLTPDWVNIQRWSRAIPQYEVGHHQRVQQIQRAIAEVPGLFVTGNYLTGVSLEDCIKQGAEAAASVQRFLASRPRKSSTMSKSR